MVSFVKVDTSVNKPVAAGFNKNPDIYLLAFYFTVGQK